jgi:hypothetical protein
MRIVEEIGVRVSSPPLVISATGGKMSDRHPSVTAVTQFFKSDHLPDHLKEIAEPCEDLKNQMLHNLPDSPELTVGLRKLLEAKDCFVRARVSDVNDGEYKPTSSVQPNV